MANHIPDINTLLHKAREVFNEKFKGQPERAAWAPGRVNLIGEHTDYNDGYVLPMALQMVTLVVGKKTNTGVCRVFTTASVNENNYVTFPVPNKALPLVHGKEHWATYVYGVVAHFAGHVSSFDAVIVSSVPLGGGVSSSASLQVAIYTLLDELDNNQHNIPKVEIAQRCLKAEHEFTGLACGIMDQLISLTAKEGHALLQDCRSLESKEVSLMDESVVVLLINSNVSHELIHTEYPKRTRQCQEAAKILGVTSLRNVTLKHLKDRKEQLDGVLYKRAHHVVTEISRTVKAAEALAEMDFSFFGKLMTDSHISLRDDYEVSCEELNELVDAALDCDGVYGSRMTGGGFGGCTVTLVKRNDVERVITHIKAQYSKTATFYICIPSGGATGIELNI